MSVRYVSDGNECLPVQWDASNLRSIYRVFSLSVLNYSAKFRRVRTRALLWNLFLLLVQISVEERFFVHTCLSAIHVFLAVFFVYYCALLFDLSIHMNFKRVHVCMSRSLRNPILRPSFPVFRGTVGPVHLQISLYWSHCIEHFSIIVRISGYYIRSPLIRKLVIRIANYPDRLGPSGKFVDNSTKLTCREITGYRIKYSTVFWPLDLQISHGRKM